LDAAQLPPARCRQRACPTSAPTADAAGGILADARRAVVATSLGTFTIELDASSAPIATANFVALARCGFYAGITFHRTGGPGYQFGVEFPSDQQSYDKDVVAMANGIDYDPATGEIRGGTDTNGSQFFIDLASLAGQLRPYYSVIGKVTEGTDVVDTIGAVPVNDPQAGVPVEPVIIESVSIGSGA